MTNIAVEEALDVVASALSAGAPAVEGRWPGYAAMYIASLPARSQALLREFQARFEAAEESHLAMLADAEAAAEGQHGY
jgi:predicted phage gp36 major capsid-like protein